MVTSCGGDGINSRSGPFIIIGFVRLTRCTVIDSFCRQTVTSNTPGPVTVTGVRFVGGPFDGVAQQFAVVEREHFPEGAIDVPREVDHAPCAVFAHEDFRDVGLRHARKDFFHRQVGIRRNQRQRRIGITRCRARVMHARDAVDDALGVLQSGEKRMTASGGRIGFEREIGILHARVRRLPSKDAPNRSRKSEVGAAHAPFVVERRLVSRDDAAAALHVGANLVALLVGERGDIGEDQDLEAIDVLGVEQPSCTISKRDARFDQRLVVAEGVVLDLLARALAAVDTARSAANRPSPTRASDSSLRRYRSFR